MMYSHWNPKVVDRFERLTVCEPNKVYKVRLLLISRYATDNTRDCFLIFVLALLIVKHLIAITLSRLGWLPSTMAFTKVLNRPHLPSISATPITPSFCLPLRFLPVGGIDLDPRAHCILKTTMAVKDRSNMIFSRLH